MHNKGMNEFGNSNSQMHQNQMPNNPNNGMIGPTSLILNISETRGDMQMAAKFEAEIATIPIYSHLMRLKFHEIYKQTKKSSEDLYQFNNLILDDGHVLSEVINSGERDFKDLLPILTKAEKFKCWLGNIENDSNIIKEYHKAVIEKTWMDKLPGKTLRWSVFTGLGLLATQTAEGVGLALKLGLSAGNAFLLDKVLKGWKPSTFVNNELKRFVKKK